MVKKIWGISVDTRWKTVITDNIRSGTLKRTLTDIFVIKQSLLKN